MIMWNVASGFSFSADSAKPGFFVLFHMLSIYNILSLGHIAKFRVLTKSVEGRVGLLKTEVRTRARTEVGRVGWFVQTAEGILIGERCFGSGHLFRPLVSGKELPEPLSSSSTFIDYRAGLNTRCCWRDSCVEAKGEWMFWEDHLSERMLPYPPSSCSRFRRSQSLAAPV